MDSYVKLKPTFKSDHVLSKEHWDELRHEGSTGGVRARFMSPVCRKILPGGFSIIFIATVACLIRHTNLICKDHHPGQHTDDSYLDSEHVVLFVGLTFNILCHPSHLCFRCPTSIGKQSKG
jgi:hypothetical protein